MDYLLNNKIQKIKLKVIKKMKFDELSINFTLYFIKQKKVS